VSTDAGGTALVRFCGEDFTVATDRPFVIGREGDLAVDDNVYLHRRLLELTRANGFWLLTNVGSQLSATVTDGQGLLQAWLAPGARLPIAFSHTVVWFSAGPTTYEVEILISDASFALTDSSSPVAEAGSVGPRTIGPAPFTRDQTLLILALTEHALRSGDRGRVSIPTNAQAAERLGWTIRKFNRKLDNVCAKLAGIGVRGLHGDAENLAAQRRARLAEYALAARLVTYHDLVLLDRKDEPSLDPEDRDDDSP
jgi:hypothetical protein